MGTHDFKLTALLEESKMPYIDGVVSAVPTANKEKFIAHAKLAAVAFKEHGALQVVECWGSDVPEGKVTGQRMIFGGFNMIVEA